MIKIKNYHKIKDGDKVIGHIQLVGYDVPQIEYELDEAYWNKGIMTRELKKYLKTLKLRGVSAIIEENNLASAKVLVKCGFVELSKIRGYRTFCKYLNYRLDY
jgi:RimJ/RimL family protein N-acetyltransferase